MRHRHALIRNEPVCRRCGAHFFACDFASIIRGHHVYKSVWTPAIGETLPLGADNGNEKDQPEDLTLSASSDGDGGFSQNTCVRSDDVWGQGFMRL